MKHKSQPVNALIRVIVPAIPFFIGKLFLNFSQPFLRAFVNQSLIKALYKDLLWLIPDWAGMRKYNIYLVPTVGKLPFDRGLGLCVWLLIVPPVHPSRKTVFLVHAVRSTDNNCGDSVQLINLGILCKQNVGVLRFHKHLAAVPLTLLI